LFEARILLLNQGTMLPWLVNFGQRRRNSVGFQVSLLRQARLLLQNREKLLLKRVVNG